jgi:asparaginyl-tRNA synthetase
MSRTLVKDALQRHRSGSTRSSSKGGSARAATPRPSRSSKLNDGSCLKGIQVIADAGLPDYATEIAKALTGASVEVRGKLVRVPRPEARNGKSSPRAFNRRSARPTPPTRSRKRATRWSSCARSRTCARARISSARSSASAAAWPTRSTSFSRSGIHLRAHAHHHRQRLRGRGRDVPRRDARRNPAKPMRRDADRGLFRQATYLTVSGQLEGETFACALSTSTPSAPPSARRTRTPRATPPSSG